MLAVLVAGACARPRAPITVERAALVPDPAAQAARLYFTVANAGDAPLAVTDVLVPGATSSALRTPAAHRVAGPGGITALEVPIESIAVPARAATHLAPGGFVVVVHRLARVLHRGDTVAFRVYVADGRSVGAVARVMTHADLDTALTGVRATTIAAPPSVAAGVALYRANGCIACHGADGHGDGRLAATLAPPPRDFRNAAAYRNGPGVDAITQTLATGLPGGGQMPLFAHLSDTERRSLALYVASLQDSSQTRTPTK